MAKVILSESMADSATGSVVIENVTYPTVDVVLIYLSVIAIIAAITIITHRLLLRNNKNQDGTLKDKYDKGLFNIMRDKYMDPSLSRFQFVAWTFVVSFAYLSIGMIRVLSGDYTPSTEIAIPANLLALMGISIGVPIAAAKIHQKDKIDDAKIAEYASYPIRFRTILRSRTGDNKFELSRFQMFMWTWLGIGVYLY